MSRRRGEFEHRTSIFEGAFRAWSHLGGLDPLDVERRPASELDPLTNPIEMDARLGGKKSSVTNPDGSSRREYPYEPLPRAGLSHPYVQAILSPWLGPDADNEAIQLGLTTLRTWWQHRRKGESGSAVAALGTEKMKGVVEGYTRHFFTLAHCLIVNDKEQPPRSLHMKMKELEKLRKKGLNKSHASSLHSSSLTSSSSTHASSSFGGDVGKLASMAMQPVGEELVASLQADLTDSNLSPLERLHAAQRRQLAESMGTSGSSMQQLMNTPIIPINGKCVPGKIDLPGIVDAVTRQASQMVHRGGGVLGTSNSGSTNTGGMMPHPSLVASGTSQISPVQQHSTSSTAGLVDATSSSSYLSQYGDPNSTPVVFVSGNGDIQIAMTVDGITCAHCVKIVETVLKGCNGNKSPIDGLLDAAADRALCSVLIKIDQASNARRIAFEASRNLAMVGYTAKAKEMSIVGPGADRKSTMDLGSLSTAFEVVANTDPKDVFDWARPCTCPDNGVLREDCPRHSQMNTGIFEAFNIREAQVTDHMAGCGMKYGMACTCGPDCRCKNCPIHSNMNTMNDNLTSLSPSSRMDPLLEEPLRIDQPMEFDFGMEPPSRHRLSLNLPSAGPPLPEVNVTHKASAAGPSMSASSSSNTDGTPSTIQFSLDASHGLGGGGMGGGVYQGQQGRRASRNPSILSYGNGGLRNMSLASDATFGRAMSGLSALSIDWENLEDFDLEVDHSAHITNGTTTAGGGSGSSSNSPTRGSGVEGRRRSSVRRSFMSTGEKDGGSHVSFKVANM